MKYFFAVTALATTAALAGPIGDFHSGVDTSHSDHCHSGRPDGHAPIGVMGDHTHGAGEWMASYRFMFMRMEQNYDGSSTVSDTTITANNGPYDYLIAPTDMDMQMHMFGVMYAPTDKLTLMGMINVVESSMNHLRADGLRFKTESSGIGDSSLGGLYRFFESDSQQAHFGLSVIFPTADIDNRDDTPLGYAQLPYPMQLGAGSWGLAPSLTWFGHAGDWSWGSQVNARFFLNDNDNDYRLGNRYEGTVWGARRWSNWLSTSLRINFSHWEDIEGADPAIRTTVPMGGRAGDPLIPTAVPELRGGSRIDLFLGANVLIPNTGARVAFEVGAPIYQDLDGPQLGAEWFATAGVQYAF